MKPTRNLSEALQAARLPEVALAFVNAGAPAPRAQPTSPDADPKPETPVPAALVPNVPRMSIGSPSAEGTPPVLPPGPVSMTFRMPADLPEALLRASMTRKLRRLKPWTQQDIVTEAIREWLNSRADDPP